MGTRRRFLFALLFCLSRFILEVNNNFLIQWLHQKQNSGSFRDWNIFMCFYLNITSNFSNVQLEVSEFNNACHKNMYKYESPGSFRRRIYFPLCIWVKRTWNQRPSFYFVSIFSGWGLPSPLIDERWEEGRFEVEILACLENNTRHDSEIFFVWKLHVLPFPCFSFSFPFTKVLRWIHWSSEFLDKQARIKSMCYGSIGCLIIQNKSVWLNTLAL